MKITATIVLLLLLSACGAPHCLGDLFSYGALPDGTGSCLGSPGDHGDGGLS